MMTIDDQDREQSRMIDQLAGLDARDLVLLAADEYLAALDQFQEAVRRINRHIRRTIV